MAEIKSPLDTDIPAASPPIAMQPEHLIQFFSYSHLPPHLQPVSKPFCELAHKIVEELPWNQERTVALRHLLDAKDAAVRARIAK